MEKILVAIAAIIDALSDKLIGFLLGLATLQAKSAKDDLKRVGKAAKARADVRLMSDDDVVRALKERGLYRDEEPSADGKRG